MKTHRALVIGFVLASLLLLLQTPQPLAAQDQSPDQAAPETADQGPVQDPPGRVARLSYSVGSVSFQPGGEGDWVDAVKNRPLSTGDNLWADKDSRAEIQTGSTSIRIDSETSLTFLDIDDHTTQLKVSQGSIIVRVRHLDDETTFEVDTPNLAFQIQRTGEYRIDVNADGTETDATVRSGRGEATGGGGSYVVVAGQRARFTGTDQIDHEIEQLRNRDDFDTFAFDRDEREDHAESSNYISPEMTGASDLDDNGTWRYVASYGPVWTPTAVAPGWAPYRYGHWVWVSPWGWTWVEDEPWGFAPFHYGRWAYVESSWCWVPGPVYVRPVYAPALVVFVGGGGYRPGGPGVAWFPLAPREVFVPWYRTSPRYVNNVNITNTRVNVTQVTNVYNTTIINNNTTNITRINYANQRVPNGVTAVSHETFVNARPVGTNTIHVDPKEVADAPVERAVPVQPIRASVMGAGRPTTARPSPTIVNRQVVATRQPTPPRVPFEQRQAPPNVRTETPGAAQPPARAANDAPRPAQPQTRPTETTRPQQPEARGEDAPRQQASPSPANARPANVPRPGSAPQEPVRATAPMSPSRPPNAQYSHPLVRSAPPVQENPQRQQNEQAKFNTWQQQRPSAPPREVSRPSQSRPPQPAPHQEKPH